MSHADTLRLWTILHNGQLAFTPYPEQYNAYDQSYRPLWQACFLFARFSGGGFGHVHSGYCQGYWGSFNLSIISRPKDSLAIPGIAEAAITKSRIIKPKFVFGAKALLNLLALSCFCLLYTSDAA